MQRHAAFEGFVMKEYRVIIETISSVNVKAETRQEAEKTDYGRIINRSEYRQQTDFVRKPHQEKASK